MFLCRYALGMLLKKNVDIQPTDEADNLFQYITEDFYFRFDQSEIKRMRTQIYTLIDSISKAYTDKRIIENEGDNSSDEDEIIALAVCHGISSAVEHMKEDNTTVSEKPYEWESISDESNGSISVEWVDNDDSDSDSDSECEYKADKDDNEIIASNMSHKTDLTFLSSIIQVGDEIEYKQHSPIHGTSHLVTRVIVTGIGYSKPGNRGKRTLILNNGATILKNIHLVRRMTLRCVLTNEIVHNPCPKWMDISKFQIISDAPIGTTTETFMMPLDNSTASMTPNERIRMSGRLTKDERKSELRRYKKYDEKLKESRKSSAWFMKWMKDSYQRSKSMKTVNSYYRQFLAFGDSEAFYNYKRLFEPLTIESFNADRENARKALSKRNRERAHRLTLMVPCSFLADYDPQAKHISDHDNIRMMTNREMLVQEKLLDWEYKMQGLNAQCCPSCHENKIINVKKENGKEYKCSGCSNNNKRSQMAKRCQPWWYECDNDGNKIKDANGNYICHTEIPDELRSLTVAEQQLIVRCRIFTPTFHLKNSSNLGYKGHAVAFPQDINEMCNELPLRKEKVVTVIRQMGHSNSTNICIEHLKVNRKRVLTALRWLKRHHRGYRHITIKEENLTDWMHDKDEANLLDGCSTKLNMVRQSLDHEQECISEQQCGLPRSAHDELDWTMVGPNTKDKYPLNKRQRQPINELTQVVEETGKLDNMMRFPPMGELPLK